MKNITLGIAQIIGGGVCVSAADGAKVYNAIITEIQKGNRVTLSFSGITRLTTAFLNAAVGQLYGEFTEEQVRTHLAPPIDVEPWHLNRLKLAVDGAKAFFRNPTGARAAFEEVTGIDDD